MEAVIGLLLMLLGVSHSVDTSCDGRQDGAQCYGALGGTLVLQLMGSVSGIFRFTWSTKSSIIFRWSDDAIKLNKIEDRSLFTPSNGTFRINYLRRTDGGEYTLQTYDSNGRALVKRTLQLTIEAPVSSVLLVSECLSQGEMRVSCSSEGGDSPQYSWTLDGHTLTDAQLLSGNNVMKNITLKRDVSGRLVCSVSNHVSNVRKEKMTPACGVETSCDGRQDGAQCYGALGGTLVLQLMDSVSGIYRIDWSKKLNPILRWKEDYISFNKIEDRSLFTPSNGTFRINYLRRTDGGEYTFYTFDSNGIVLKQRTLQLTIQAPVSSVLLVSECLSQGEMRVSCSSEGGDSPQYSWTLDGHTLKDAQLLSGNNETNNITLKRDVSGQLVCSVSNHINRISTCGFMVIDCTLFKGMHISQRVLVSKNTRCIEPPTATTEDRSLLICGLRAAVVILILLGIAVYFAWKKKKQEKAEDSARRQMDYQENSVVMVEMRSSSS